MTDDLRLPSAAPIALLILIILSVVAMPLSSWEYTEFDLDLEGRIAMMATAGKWNPYVEVKGVFDSDGSKAPYSSLSAGTYFRAAPWLKVGAFYRLQIGARYVDDWTVALPDNHSWNDVSGRTENLIYLDATPRFLLPWLPGRNWVLPVKIRYFYNFRNSDQTMLLRPGLTYVIMPNRKPLVTLSFNYSLYFALNHNEVPLYAQGPYLTVLGHINDWFKIEGRVDYLMKTYQKNEFGGTWILHSQQLIIGLGVIFTPDFTPSK